MASKVCRICCNVKSIDSFRNSTIKTCLSCADARKIHDRRYKDRHWWKNMISATKKSDTRKGFYDEAKHIDAEFLMGKFVEQKGNCYYCDVKCTTVATKQIARTKLTVERKNNAKGHTKDNCILACHYCNVFRGNRFSFRDYLRFKGKLPQKNIKVDTLVDGIKALYN